MKSKCSFILKAGLSLVLALLMLFGTMTTGIAAVVESAGTSAKADVADTGASVDLASTGATYPAGMKLYIKPSSDWKRDSAKFKVYVWDDSSHNANSAVATQCTFDTNYYVATVPSGYTWTHYKWRRMDSNGTDDWGWVADARNNNGGAQNAYWNEGWDSNGGYYNIWVPDSVIYFDGTVNTSWDGYSMFVKGSNSGTTDGVSTTKIATHLYKYKFTSMWDNCNAYWWRGSNANTLWNYSKGMDPGDYHFSGKNAVATTGSGVTQGDNGTAKTVAALSLTSISAPTLSATTTTPTYGDSNTITASGNTLNYTFNGGARTTTLLSTDAIYNFYVDGSAVAAQSSTTKTYDASGLSVGSHTITCKISSTLTGLTSSAGSIAINVATPTHSVSRSSAPTNGTLQVSADNSSFSNGPIDIAEGANYYVKATPNTGYKITNLTVAGGTIGGATGQTSAYTYTGTMGASDVTVSATFAKQTFTVNYNKGSNGTGTNTSDTKTYGDALTLKGAIFTRTGYTQTAWNTNSSGTGGTSYALSGSYTANSGTTLYPTWTENTYTITYKDDDDTAIDGLSPTSRTYTQAVNTLPTPTKSGYNFLGWFTAADGGEEVTSIAANTASNTTLYAHWAVAGTCGFDLSASSGTVTIGNTTTFTITPNGFHDGRVYTVTSDDSTVATVTGSNTGSGTATYTVKGIKAGSTTISISCAEGGSATYSITVSTPTVAFGSTAAASINIGGTVQRVATGSAIGTVTSDTITYTSSNTNYATVAADGTVTGVAPGTVTISATRTIVCDNQTTTVNTSTNYSVTVNTPTISVGNNNTLLVGGTYTPSPSLSNPGSTGSGWTVVYTKTSGTSASTNGSTITGENYGSGTTFKASFRYNGVEKAYDTFTVTPVTPTVSFSDYSSVNVGGTSDAGSVTATNVGSLTKSFDITSGAAYATINTSTGAVTGVAPGNVEVTVYYKKGGTTIISDTANITVTPASVSITSANSANVDGTVTLAASSSGATTTPTYTWSVTPVSGTASITNGVLKALTPGTVTVSVAARYNASYTVNQTQTFTINAPSLTMADQTIAVGDGGAFTASSSNPSGLSFTYAIKAAYSGVTVNSDGSVVVSSSAAPGTATVVATAHNAAGTAVGTVEADLEIEDVTVKIDGSSSVADPYYLTSGGSAATKTVTYNFTPDSTSISYSKDGVATAVLAGSTLTITPVAKGTTTITLTASKSTAPGVAGARRLTAYKLKNFEYATTGTGAISDSIEFTVNVGDPGETFILFHENDGNGDGNWANAYIYLEYSDGSSATSLTQMTYIGKDEYYHKVWAYKITQAKFNVVSKVVFCKDSDWPSYDDANAWKQTKDYVVSGNNPMKHGFYKNGQDSSDHYKYNLGTFNTEIIVPQVSVDDATVAMGDTLDVTGTNVNNIGIGKVTWSPTTSDYAYFDDDDTGSSLDNTMSTGTEAGTQTITITAYAAMPTGWKLWNDSPITSSSDTATITVTADNKTISYGSYISDDHSSYADAGATNPGTITATKKNTATTYASGDSVEHGTDIVFSAVPAANYKLVGWDTDGDGDLDVSTDTCEIHLTANTTVNAMYDHVYTLTYSIADGSTGHVTVSRASEVVVWNVTPASITVTPANGYMIDYDNCTNLSKFFTVDTAATNAPGGVTIPGKTVAAGDKADTTVTIAVKKVQYTITSVAEYNNTGDGWHTGTLGGTISVTNNTEGKGTFEYGDTITITATAAAADNDCSFMAYSIEYSNDNSTWYTVTTVPTAAAATYDTTTMTNNTFELNAVGASTYYFRARFKGVYYISLYNTYMKDANDEWQFVAAPPKKVEIGTGGSKRTLTYAAGTAAQRGEENVKTSGTYYEGNKILVYAGEQVKLTYSGLASSDAIIGVFYNNNLRYTTETEDDNLYKLRVAYTGDDPDCWGDDGDDEWEYDYGVNTTLFADKYYYSGAVATTIDANDGSYEAQSGVDQDDFTVTWAATKNYLNIDMELDSKYQVIINDGDDTGLEIANMNDEGYYSRSETFNAAFTISKAASTADYSFTWSSITATVKYYDKDGVEVADPGTMTVTGYQSNGTTAATNTGNLSKFKVTGTMPGYTVKITIPVQKVYKMRLANIVVADAFAGRTMITEGGSSSDTTNYVADITASAKLGDAAPTNISSDGTYYTYDGNNNPTHVEAYTTSSSNKKLNGGVNKDGSDVVDGTVVTYTFTPKSFGGDYSFVGWYEGSLNANGYSFDVDYSKKLSGKTTFTYTPKKNTVVIAVATRDLYIGGNFTSAGVFTTTSGNMTYTSGRIKMSYDPTYVKSGGSSTEKGRYYYTFESVTPNSEYQFRCYDTSSGTATTGLNVWQTWTGSDYANDNDDILFGRHKYDAANGASHGQFVFKTNTNNWSLIDNSADNHSSTKNHAGLGYGAPVTVYFYAYDGGITVESTYQWSMAYVSEGRGIDVLDPAKDNETAGKYNAPTASVASTTVKGGTVSVTTRNNYYGTANNGGKYEKIYDCQVKEKNGQIVVTAYPNDVNVDVQAFLVYNIETKKSEAVLGPFETTGTGASTGYIGHITIPQNTKVYVVPIYKFTDTYISSAGLESHTVYVRTDDIDKSKWGGLVAMYSWGTDARYNSGGYPGQLMIPSDDGTSFYAPLTFTQGGLGGVLFDNYVKIWDGQPANFLGTYVSKSVSDVAYCESVNKGYQTYDYREPISIIDNINTDDNDDDISDIYKTDDMDLTFELKPGDVSAAPAINTAGSGAHNRVTDWSSVGYLTDRSGEHRVDLNGNTCGNVTESYHIVAYYTNQYATVGQYDFSSNGRSGTSYVGTYSINWAVYDASGTSILAGSGNLSAVYTDVVGLEEDINTYIATKLLDAGHPVNGKAVKIAYEKPGTWDEAVRYAGQWYADGVNELITAKTRIGIISDGVFQPMDTNYAGFGQATFSGTINSPADRGESFTAEFSNGNSLANVTKYTASNAKLTLTATDPSDKFIGWYIYNDETEDYEPVNTLYENKSLNLSFNDDITYYAFYSAAASYKVKYTGRDGSTKEYIVSGYDLTQEEMGTGNGYLDATARASDIEEKLAGISDRIKVFNSTLTVDLDHPDANPPKYELDFTATSTVTNYKLTVYAYNGSGELVKQTDGVHDYIEGTFNSEISLTSSALGGAGVSLVTNKPAGCSDYVFVGWKKYSEGSGFSGSILSTLPNFGYSITEDLTIAPVFEESITAANTWAASVDKNVITQELTGTNSGKIYNDNIISFRYSDDTGERFDYSTYDCGIVILAQTGGVSTAQSDAFDDANAQTYFNALKTADKTSARMNKTTYGESYAFYIQAVSLSRLNRVDIFQHLDYAKFAGGKYKVMAYFKDPDSGEYRYSSVVTGDYVPHTTSVND